MAGFQIGGIVSGLETDKLLQQLMALERQPVVRLEQKQLELERKADAWRDVRSRLTSLLNRVGELRTASTYTGMKASTSKEGLVTVATMTGAEAASYELVVEQLAVTQRNTSGRHGDIKAALGLEGDLIIADTAGDKSWELGLEAGDSLTTVMQKINASQAGVRASLVDGHLIITGEDLGSFTLADGSDGDILSELKLTENEGMQVRAAQKAQVFIDGVKIESDSNTLKDVIPGLSLRLTGEGTTSVTVSQDTDRALAAVKGFIEQYNSTFDFISNQLKYDVDTKTKGTLFAEGALMQIQSNLRQKVGGVVEGLPRELNTLIQLGITTGKIGTGTAATGKLELDEGKFLAKLKEDPQGVADLFKALGDDLLEDLTGLTKSTTGIISGREKAVKDQIGALKKQMEQWEYRLEKKEESLVKQFTALEKALSQLYSQGTWLAGQIDSLAAGWGYGRNN